MLKGMLTTKLAKGMFSGMLLCQIMSPHNLCIIADFPLLFQFTLKWWSRRHLNFNLVFSVPMTLMGVQTEVSESLQDDTGRHLEEFLEIVYTRQPHTSK